MIDEHATFERTRVGGAGAALLASGLVVLAGGPGAVGGLLVVLVWYVQSDLAAYATGHVAIAAVAPATIDVPSGGAPLTPGTVAASVPVVVLALAALPLLLGHCTRASRPVSSVLAALVAVLSLSAVALAPPFAGWGTLAGAVVLLAAFAVVAYGLHRYALVVAGVVPRG